MTLTCERWLEAVSALADGEDPGIDVRLVEAHAARCPRCRSLREQFERLGRVARVEPAPSMPDLSRPVVSLNAMVDRASRSTIVRGLLAVVAVVVIGLSARDLVVAEEQGVSGHGVRHLGAFTLAYGVALLVVVFRPARARTVLPVACTLAAAVVITAILDVAYGYVPISGEAWQHIPELLSMVLVWLLAAPSFHPTDGRAQREPRETPSLRIVGDRPDEPGPHRRAG